MPIKVQCPQCGKQMMLKDLANIEEKTLKCTNVNCGYTAKVKDFKHLSTINPSEESDVTTTKNTIIGHLRLPSNGKIYPLKMGKNLIGRKASTSQATIQIEPPTPQSRISREHLVVEVTDHPEVGYRHTMKLYKPTVNKTIIGVNQMEFGDVYVLTDGMRITLPDNMELVFEIPDPENTL